MAEYEGCIMGPKIAIDKDIQELLVIRDSDLPIHQIQGEWTVKNSKIAPYMKLVQMLCKRFRKIEFSYIDPVEIYLKELLAHCSHVEAEPDRIPWYFDIKKYLETRTYQDNATFNQKKAIRRMANNFFPSGETLYRRTPDMGLLRYIDAVETMKLLKQIHAGVYGTHMNGLTLAKKIFRSGYF
ncbi:uncharacterized protein LOC129883433 [Solanum dulcamara]|uniref:uncharacterized protein LOC129883433 n=1 Tax=Solanum dulcamara TaxID=45834 RepID=UPI0024864971|nr:uncharacterized protein LOC129883433 [Solanum dulcamara]